MKNTNLFFGLRSYLDNDSLKRSRNFAGSIIE